MSGLLDIGPGNGHAEANGNANPSEGPTAPPVAPAADSTPTASNLQDSRSETEKAPPVLNGTHRVALDGGKRHVELTPDRIAELVTEHEQREDIESARRALQQTSARSAVMDQLERAMGQMTPEQQQAFLLASQDPTRLSALNQQPPQQDQQHQADDEPEHDRISRVVRGEQPPVNGAQGDQSRLDAIENVVRALASREDARDQQHHQESIGQHVDKLLAENGVFKTDPDGTVADKPIAKWAKDIVMLQLGQSQDPMRDAQRLVLDAAQRADELEQQKLQATVEPLREAQTAADPLRDIFASPERRSGRDLQRGVLKQDAQSAYERWFGPHSPRL